MFEYRDGLAGLLELLFFTQRTVIIMHIPMNTDFSADLRDLPDQRRMPFEYYCRNIESRHAAVVTRRINYLVQCMPYASLCKPKARKHGAQAS